MSVHEQQGAHPTNRQTISNGLVIAGLSVVLLIPFLISSQTVFPYVVSKTTAIYIAAALCTLSLALSSSKRWNLTLVHKVCLGYLAVLTIATIFGSNVERSLFSTFERSQGLLVTFSWFLFAFALSQLVHGETSWRRVFLAAAYLGYTYCLMASLHLFNILPIDNLYQDGDRLSYTIGNASLMGAYVACLVPVSTVLLSSAIRQKLFSPQTIIHGTGLVVCLNALAATGSRGAFIAVAAWACLLLTQIPRRYWLPVVIAGLTVVAMIIFVNLDLLSDRLSDSTLSNIAILGRIDAWMIGLRAIATLPILGWGPENFLIAFGQLAAAGEAGPDTFDHAHSHLIDIAVTSGSLGLVTYVALIGSILINGLRKLKQTTGFEKDHLSIALGILLTYQISGLFLFEAAANQLWFYLALAYVLACTPKTWSVNTSLVSRVATATVAGACMVYGSLLWAEARQLMQLQTGNWQASVTNTWHRTEDKVALASEEIWQNWRSLPVEQKAIALQLLLELDAEQTEQFTWRGVSKLGYAWLRVSVDFPEYSQQLVRVANRLQALAPERWETAEFLAYFYLAQRKNNDAIVVLKAYLAKDPDSQRLNALLRRLES